MNLALGTETRNYRPAVDEDQHCESAQMHCLKISTWSSLSVLSCETVRGPTAAHLLTLEYSTAHSEYLISS